MEKINWDFNRKKKNVNACGSNYVTEGTAVSTAANGFQGAQIHSYDRLGPNTH